MAIKTGSQLRLYPNIQQSTQKKIVSLKLDSVKDRIVSHHFKARKQNQNIANRGQGLTLGS